MTRPEDEILAANRAFYEAFEALDLEAMSAIWSASAPVSCVHPGAGPLVGRPQVLASWKGIFRGTRAISFTLRDPRVMVAGDIAWVILVEELDSRYDDVRVRGAALATNVFVRENGDWRLVHHHASPAVNVESESLDVDEDDEPPENLLN